MTLRVLFENFSKIEDHNERRLYACRNPLLLSGVLMDSLRAELQKEQALDRAKNFLAELADLRLTLEQHPNRFPIGAGPVDALASRVIRGELSIDAAIEQARTPEITSQLVPLYVNALVWRGEKLAGEASPGVAVSLLRLLAEACLAASPENTTGDELVTAGVMLIQVTSAALASLPDGKLLQEADAFGNELLRRLTLPADAKRRADVLHAMGCLYSDPISSTNGAGVTESSRREWLRRLETEKGAALAQHYLDQYPLPETRVSLQKAIDYFTDAAAGRTGADRGMTLRALGQTLIFLDRCNETDANQTRARDILLEALTLLQPGGYHYMVGVRLLQSIGCAVTAPTTTANFAADSPDELLQHAAGLEASCPAEALSLLVKAEGLFNATASESQRTSRLSFFARALPEIYGGPVPVDFEGLTMDLFKMTVDRAKADKWSSDQFTAALIGLMLRCLDRDEETLGLRLWEMASRASTTMAGYGETLAFLSSGLRIRAGEAAGTAKQTLDALKFYAQALSPSMQLKLHTRTLNLLGRMADLASAPLEEMLFTVLTTLAPVAFQIERELGAAGGEALQAIYQNTIANMIDPVNSSVFSMVLQLAKSLRFSAMLRDGPGFDWRKDPGAVELANRIQTLEKQLGEVGQYDAVDEVLLVTPFSAARATGGGDAGEQLENLQREFDRRITRGMSEAARNVAILQPEAIRQLLGQRTVLLDYYFAPGPGNQFAVQITLYTAEDILIFKNPVPWDGQKAVVHSAKADGVLDPMGYRTWRLRQSLALDPRPDSLHPAAKMALAEDFSALLGRPLWTHLQTLRQGGKDHLCICPHGALQFYPWHLLGQGDENLAQNWIVTAIPSLECLQRKPTAPRPTAGLALGLTYSGPDPFDLPSLDNARDEVKAVAREFGTAPLLDDKVTEERVVQALQSARRVHLCAHGVQNAASPLFQCLFLTPGAQSDGRICAYEVVGLDLRGLEVLSLGSCDSGLGRFDAGDNPRGLPAALLLGGVSSIVASLWEMSDDAARTFFTCFYRELQTNIPRLDAFHRAQTATRKLYPQARDWAAFCFMGGWDSPEAIPALGDGAYIKLAGF